MIAIAARRTDYIQRFLLLALMLCVSACGGGHDAAPTTTSSAASSATSDHAEAKARSQNVLDRAIEAGSPGCSAVVGVKGNAVWTGVRGVADMSSGTAITTQAVFDIASVSKQFTARQPGAVATSRSPGSPRIVPASSSRRGRSGTNT